MCWVCLLPAIQLIHVAYLPNDKIFAHASLLDVQSDSVEVEFSSPHLKTRVLCLEYIMTRPCASLGAQPASKPRVVVGMDRQRAVAICSALQLLEQKEALLVELRNLNSMADAMVSSTIATLILLNVTLEDLWQSKRREIPRTLRLVNCTIRSHKQATRAPFAKFS